MTNNTPVKTILILAANPTNTAPLRLDEEIREIDEGLRRANKREQYKLEQKWAVRSRDFYRAILDYQPHIVHFCGHGAGEDGIVLEDDTGKMALVQTNALASMFKLFAQKGVDCVILNACYSEVQAEAISQYVNYVIGMNRAVGDRAALAFAVGFYDAIAAGYEVEGAYELGCSQMISFLEKETPVLKKKKLTASATDEISINFEDEIPPNPYQGLSAFGEEDADFFFGQEKFVNNLVEVTHKQPLVSVIGPSGSGKSSVVFAGVTPKLLKERNWLIETFRPGKEPFSALAFALVRQLEPEAGETQKLRESVALGSDMQQGRITLQQVASRILTKNPGKKLLLVADQFEELYTLCLEKQEQKQFIDELLTAISEKSITLVLTLRADFLGYVLSYPRFKDILQEFTPQFLSSMKRGELQQAIELPAHKLEVQLETQLTQRILDDVGQEPGNLPLLEFALTRLWEKQVNRELTHQAYEEIGGVKKAIANHAEQVYQQLSETEKKQTQRIFVQLVRPGEGTEDTRRVATRAEVGEENWNLVSYLAGYPARLVVTGQQEQEDTVEVVHEALIREWGTFRDWINASRQFRTWQERLKVLLQDWKNNNYDTEGLLRGVPLSVAEDWLNKHPEQLRIEEQKFIQKSINREKRKEIFKKFTFGLLTISLVFVTGLVFKNRYNFEITNLSISSQSLLESDKQFQGLIEILKASNKLKTPLLSTTTNRNSVIINLRKAVYETRELNRLEKHQGGVTSISFSKDGQILTSAYDKHLILWSQEGRLLQDFGEVHKDTIWKATFSPNGKIIASASKDKTVKLWSQQNGTWVLKSTLRHSHPVRVVKFSPNGGIIASSDDDSNIKLWSSDGQPLNSIKANQGWLLSMSFKDNQTLATGGGDGSVKFWRSQNGTFKDVELLGTLRGHSKRGVWSLDFSHDGKMLVTGGGDGTIKLWRKQAESKSNDWIRDLKFSLDQKTLGEICDNQLKKSQNGIEYSCLKASKDFVRGVSFSPDNQIIAGGTWDKHILLWYWDRPGMTSETLNGHGNGVWDVKFSSDGKILASASDDNTVKLWNTKETPKAFGEAESPILDVSFSPDGQRIASASKCKIVKQLDVNGNSINKDLVDVTLSQSPDPHCYNRTVRSHSEKVYEVAFSPLDGKVMITASADCTIKLWDADGHLIKPLIDASIETKNKKCSSKSSHSKAVQGVAFSPDGKNIASASLDNTIKLWNTQDGSLIKNL
ncbi:nSTAND1 domain-containing NTPase [Microcoleus sp. D3_18_C4]|uniref:nSTAND1 domain-containing NTPase n=1 Tax=Microcoleus sp. D3_18_C4 TaxID=3055335 RepID=UPI002FD28B1E